MMHFHVTQSCTQWELALLYDKNGTLDAEKIISGLIDWTEVGTLCTCTRIVY